MSTKLEYLKLSIQNGEVLGNKDWFFYCIAIPKLKQSEQPKEELALFTTPDGLFYSTLVEGEWKAIQITDFKENEALYKFNDKLSVDSSWLPSISKPLETTIGRLVYNSLIIHGCFGTKVPYINEVDGGGLVNRILVEKLRDEDKATGDEIKVSEMVKAIDALTYISSLGTIINTASTVKTITAPDNIDKIKKEIVKKYEGQLGSHVKQLEFEAELDKVDSDYLADDPDAAKILTGKTRAARRKMYLTFGKPSGFDETTPILASLSDGVEVSRANLPQYIDDLRFGSQSRGGSTAKSGYIYKLLQRALTSLAISDKSCDTTKGYVREVTKENYLTNLDRSVKVGGKWKLLTTPDEAKSFIGQKVEIRSTMYCTAGGGFVCYSCMSENYKGNEAGISNLAAVFSDALMSLFLKQMHSSNVELVTIDLKDLAT